VELSSTSYALLGLLSHGRELTGYDLKRRADAVLRHFYGSPAMSVVYTDLKRLSEQGLVTARDVPQDDVRHKRVYRITGAGRDVLAAWVRDAPVEAPSLKHSVALRVWLGDLAGPARLIEIVQEHKAQTEAVLEELRRMESTTDPGLVYPRLVMRWSQRYHEHERAAADQLLRELGVLHRRTSPPPAEPTPDAAPEPTPDAASAAATPAAGGSTGG
jgi:DNA-binding PadR family transcriptional regulator